MAKSGKTIRPKMMVAKADQVRRVKYRQLKKKYCYATGGSGRRFWLGVALRRQLRSYYGKRGNKKASTKRGPVWTIINSTSQATGLVQEDDNDEGEGVEDDVTEAQFEESVEQKRDSLDDAKVEGDQYLFLADETLPPLEGGSQNMSLDNRETAALRLVPCPLEPTHFFKSLRSKGIKILEDIEAHVTTSNNNCNHPQLKDLVFDRPLELGTTPLLLACHYGDVDWVKRLVEDWGVDVNVAAAYFLYNGLYSHGPKISKATPLFAAAFNGHISIVEYLVGKGASVSSKTSCEDFDGYYDDWTPLYGFFYQLYGLRTSKENVTNIVRFLLESGADPNYVPSNRPPIWMSQTCGVGATTTLIHRGLDLKQLNSDGETVLHHWVNAHSTYSFCPDFKRDLFGVVQLLVDKGADLMAQDNKGNTVILAAVKNQDWNTIDYILDKEGVNRMEKIEAAEVAAATILSKSYKHSECERAFGYWRRALHLRQTDPDPTQKTILVLESGQAGEWITSDQLEHVIKHPSEYKFQSFLVRLRICSNRSWRAVLDLIDNSFNDCLVDLNSQGRLVDLLDVLWATFETFHRNIHLFDFETDYDLRSMIDNVVENLITMLSKLELDDPLLNVKTLKLALEVMVAANDFVFNLDDSDIGNWSYCYSDHQDNPHMNLLLRFFAFLAGLPYEILTPAIRQPLRQLVLKNKFGENRQTLLHMACEVEDLPTIWLLLLSGANPNAADKDGNVPLHVLADQSQYGDDDVIKRAAHLLLEYGAQLERTNDAGETAADVWIRCHDPEAGFNDPPEWCLKPVTVPTLRCLSARVVRAQNLPTNELPVDLIPFVEMRELSG